MEYRKPDDTSKVEHDILDSASKDIIDAIEAKDSKKLSMAIRSAFSMLESEPHEEASDSSIDIA